MKWDNEIPFLVSEKTGLEEGYIKEVIKCCLNVGLFNKTIYEANEILTSKGIQERFNEICKISKRKYQIKEYSLINSEENGIYSEEMNINSEETTINSELSTQRKEKESKVKKSKVNTPIIPQGEENEIYLEEFQLQLPKQPEKDISKKVAQKKVFIPPSSESVQAYCDERQNGITGEEFVNFYQSKGWKVGDQKMVDWKAAVRTWENKRKTMENQVIIQEPQEIIFHQTSNLQYPGRSCKSYQKFCKGKYPGSLLKTLVLIPKVS